MSYRKLKIWQKSKRIAVEVHDMTMKELPKFEMYEQGQQIRRSSKSVCALIVEGYGRKRYPKDYLRFLIYALGSNDESITHLEILWETQSLKNEKLYLHLRSNIDELGKMLQTYIQRLESSVRRR